MESRDYLRDFIPRRALSSALKEIRCGCFVPDLTRFTAPPCEGARRNECYQ